MNITCETIYNTYKSLHCEIELLLSISCDCTTFLTADSLLYEPCAPTQNLHRAPHSPAPRPLEPFLVIPPVRARARPWLCARAAVLHSVRFGPSLVRPFSCFAVPSRQRLQVTGEPNVSLCPPSPATDEAEPTIDPHSQSQACEHTRAVGKLLLGVEERVTLVMVYYTASWLWKARGIPNHFQNVDSFYP